MSASVAEVSGPAPPPVGSPAAVTAWRKQLKPWLAALLDARLRVYLPALATVSDMEKLWLNVMGPSGQRNNPTVWTLLIEALEILELLARVDHKSAWQLLFEMAGMARTMELYGDQLLPPGKTVMPRFVVHIGTDALLEETETTVQSCIRFIIVNEQTSSVKYGHVKETLLSQWRDQHGGQHVFDRDVDGRVKISLDFRAIMDFDDEADTGFVFSQIQNVAFAHSDLSLLQRVDREAQDGQEDEEDGEDDEGSGDNGEEEEGRNDRDDGEADEEEDQHQEQEEDTGWERESAEPENGEDELVDELVDNESTPAHRNPNPPPRGPFEIESFRFELLDHPVNNLVLYMINEAGKSGMCLSHLTISTLWHARLHHSVIGGFLLNQLVPWRGRRDTLGIRNLILDLGGFDAAAVRALCTAIAHSRSLREFQFRADQFTHENPTQADGDVWWPWLAYALFSGDADHNIHKVWLNVEDLETSHVEIVRQVLEHTDPLSFLFQRAQGQSSSSQPTEGPAMAASLNPSALLRLGHHRVVAEGHESEIPGVRVREPGVTYQVVRNRPEEDYIEFLLPGTGVCWTERKELIELQPLTRREQHPIHELLLENIDRESGPGVVELLALIGEPIQRLTVAAGGDDTIPTTVFRAIQTSCRKLKHLRVNSSWATELEWLFTDWALESLVLTSANVEDAASWSQLCTHLSDPTAALTKSLRELHVDVVYTSLPVDRRVDRVLSMLGDMLEKNHRLLRFGVSGCHEKEFVKHKDRIMAHHNEPICVERAPLARDAKLAFLSVTTPLKSTLSDEDDPHRKRAKHTAATATTTSLARTRLDPHVLRTIMEMAAESERRICGIVSSGVALPGL